MNFRKFYLETGLWKLFWLKGSDERFWYEYNMFQDYREGLNKDYPDLMGLLLSMKIVNDQLDEVFIRY